MGTWEHWGTGGWDNTEAAPGAGGSELGLSPFPRKGMGTAAVLHFYHVYKSTIPPVQMGKVVLSLLCLPEELAETPSHSAENK